MPICQKSKEVTKQLLCVFKKKMVPCIYIILIVWQFFFFIFQVNPLKYDSIFSGLSTLVKEQGPMSLWRGWTGKFFGYGFQGGCRFGLYEYFKKKYSDVLVGQKNRSVIYFVSSASAQVFADIALCPFESVKVRVQTQPKFAKGLADGFPRVYASEGLFGLVTFFISSPPQNVIISLCVSSIMQNVMYYREREVY